MQSVVVMIVVMLNAIMPSSCTQRFTISPIIEDAIIPSGILLRAVMLSVLFKPIMLSVVLLSVVINPIMLSVIMLSVISLSV